MPRAAQCVAGQSVPIIVVHANSPSGSSTSSIEQSLSTSYFDTYFASTPYTSPTIRSVHQHYSASLSTFTFPSGADSIFPLSIPIFFTGITAIVIASANMSISFPKCISYLPHLLLGALSPIFQANSFDVILRLML